MGEIEICVGDESGKNVGFVKIEATVINKFFAVHGQRGAWAVTHIPTGRAMGFDLPWKKDAIELARALVTVEVDWSRDKLEEFTPGEIEIIKEALAKFYNGGVG